MIERALLLASVTLLGAAPLRGQTVNGTVLDSATTRPVSGVTTELLDRVGRVVASAAADDSGRFRVTAPDTGTFQLQVRRIGYRTALSGDLQLGLNGLVLVDVRLPPLPVTLAPIKVEKDQDTYLVGRGYYQRKESERGTFLDPEQVDKLAPKARLLADILDHIPGVRTVTATTSGGVRVPHLRGCTPRLSRSRTASPQASMNDESMFPRIYVDGSEVDRGVLGSIQPSEVLAVEVYTGPSQIPLQYGGTNTPCGVVLIWTKH